MTTEKQLQANRANAGKSTGPISEAGKAISRQNALTHGLTAEILLLWGENEEDYSAFLREFEVEFAPEGRLELEYVGRLANLAWRLRRIPAFEVAMIAWLGSQSDLSKYHRRDRATMWLGQALDAVMNGDLLDKLSRHEVHLSRQFRQTLEDLEKAKALRLAGASGRRPPITIDNAPAQYQAGQGQLEPDRSDDQGQPVADRSDD